MAIGTNWTLIGQSSRYYVGAAQGYLNLYAKYNSQSKTGNTTNYTLALDLVVDVGYFGNYQSTPWALSGTGISTSGDIGSGSHGTQTLGSASATVSHDANGNAYISASGALNLTAWGITLYVEGGDYLPSIDRSKPIVSFSVDKRDVETISITANSNIACNSWDYSINNGASWVNFSSANTTKVSCNITGLSVNTTYNIKVRARKTSNYVYGTSDAQSVGTLGIASGENISAVIGDTINITWTRYVTEYVHTVTYKFGNKSGTLGTNLVSSVTWEIPMSLLYEIPNDVVGYGEYTISTYSGTTLIGSTTYTLELSIPESVKPQFSFVLSDVGQTSIQNAFVSGFSKVKATINVTNINNLYGATIKSAKLKISNYSEQTTDYSPDKPFEIISDTINQSGGLNIAITVIDSRGNNITRLQSFFVYSFDRPSISDISFIIGENQCIIDIYGNITRLKINGSDHNIGTISLEAKRVSQSNRYIVISNYEIIQSEFLYPDTDIGDFHVRIVDNTPGAEFINSESYEYFVQLEDLVYRGSSAIPEYSEQTGVTCISRFAGGKGVAFFGEAFADGIHYYLEDGSIAKESLTKSEWEDLYELFGIEVTDNMFKLLDVLKNAGGSPVGSITQYAGSTAPNNWLICNGEAISREDYARLFEVIGTTYGEGDGSTTFNLPNLVDRFSVGAGNSYELGSTGGSTTSGGPSTDTSGSTAITTNQMPSHRHHMTGYWSVNHTSYDVQAFGFPDSAPTYQYTDAVGGNQGHTHTLSNHTHSATPPYLALNYIIKVR